MSEFVEDRKDFIAEFIGTRTEVRMQHVLIALSLQGENRRYRVELGRVLRELGFEPKAGRKHLWLRTAEAAETLPEPDLWIDVIDTWLAGRTETTAAAVLGDALKVPAERWGKNGNGHRVGRCLRALGFQPPTPRRRTWVKTAEVL